MGSHINLENARSRRMQHDTMFRIPTWDVAALGSTAADAAPIFEGFNLVSAADATKGVILPTSTAGNEGAIVIVKNVDAANAILKIWPGGTDNVNALTAQAAFSIAAKTSAMLVKKGAIWYSTPLLPS